MTADCLLEGLFKLGDSKPPILRRIAVQITAVFITSIVATTPVALAADEISGIHEVIFGVSDLDEAAEYWTRFGFHVVDDGELSEEEAMALYHVPSAPKSFGCSILIRTARLFASGNGRMGLDPAPASSLF